MAPSDSTDHVERNRRHWNDQSAEYQHRHAPQLPTREPTWGVWGLPERELRVLGDVAGKDIVELGCGGAQFSIGLARMGARCTGIDVSERQVEFARQLIERESAADGALLAVTVLQGNAEQTGLPGAAFDIAFCDYGASIFCDPYLLVPEAARLLRTGGLLAFSTTTAVAELAWPDDAQTPGTSFVRDYFGLHRIEDADGAVVFQLGYGDWIRLFRDNGFEILDLIETRPREGVRETTYRTPDAVEWARHWPGEQIWRLRLS